VGLHWNRHYEIDESQAEVVLQLWTIAMSRGELQ
jgi:hypothetical protein